MRRLLPQRGPAARLAAAGAAPAPRPRGSARRRGRSRGGARGSAPRSSAYEGKQLLDRRRRVRLGEAQDDAVSPYRVSTSCPVARRTRASIAIAPGRVDAPAERRGEQAHPPVAHLVVVPLDDDRPAFGTSPVVACCWSQVRTQTTGGQSSRRARPARLVLADELAPTADGAPAAGPPRPSPFQNGILPGRRRGRDEHAVAGHLLDPPRRRAEWNTAPPRLVDHLLVELADPHAVPLATGEEHAVETAVRDGAAVRQRHAARTGPRPHGAGRAVARRAGPEAREGVGGVAPGEHVEHARRSGAARKLGEGRGPGGSQLAHSSLERAPGSPVWRRSRRSCCASTSSGLRGYHGVLDEPLAHAPRHDRALEQVGAELGEDAAALRLAHAVTGAADALQAARHRRGRLDLEHEVDRAHVDAQLERGGGHQARQLPRLELVLDDEALLPSERAVVGAGDIVHAGRGQRPASSAARSLSRVARRSAARRLLTKTSVERCSRISSSRRGCITGQIAAPRRPRRRRARRRLDRRPARHRLHRDVERQVERLAHPGVDHRAPRRGPTSSARPPRAAAGSRRGRCAGAARPAGCGQPLERRAARWAPRLVGARACTSSTMTPGR